MRLSAWKSMIGSQSRAQVKRLNCSSAQKRRGTWRLGGRCVWLAAATPSSRLKPATVNVVGGGGGGLHDYFFHAGRSSQIEGILDRSAELSVSVSQCLSSLYP